VQSTDFVVVGGGIAGLRAAIELAPHGRVQILTKAEPTESNTGYAQGGIAAAVGDDDSPALHGEDTIRAGDGLCDEEAVRVLVESGPAGVRELIDWGAAFECDSDGRLVLGREAAHSVRRVLHAGDATGREIGRVLWQRVSAEPSVQTIDHALVTEILVEGSGRGRLVTGVVGYDAHGKRHEYRARATLLATGGAGRAFSDTTNPPVATGDGIALAYHAGARVADLEFVQFHPTALNLKGAPRFLISEALRGEGARLVNCHQHPFMARSHPLGDLAPRDVVARGIVREMERTGGPVFLTLAHLDPDFVIRRFPTITTMCRQVGLNLARDPIPVGPAAHYMMGGVDTDDWGRTSVPALFAAGEVACTGLHGANRLASNSLLEGLVFGARAARAMLASPRAALLKQNRRLQRDPVPVFEREGFSRTSSRDERVSGATELPTTIPAIQALMWRSVGLFRERSGLHAAVARLEAAAALPAAMTVEASRERNLLTVATLIARAALRREESRGGHFREDFPERDDIHWKVHLADEQHG
jgi:L-aspartate oxidase